MIRCPHTSLRFRDQSYTLRCEACLLEWTATTADGTPDTSRRSAHVDTHTPRSDATASGASEEIPQ